ncbi:MAG: hypothetical protein K0R97_3116 [Oerskovia sp.]|nr:hypothetical protein [Oerskovia sp.]
MPKLRTEIYGGGDMSWLDSSHGIANARTDILDISAFAAATYYPDGYIKSGTPVAKVGNVLVPYDKTEATVTDAGILWGCLLTDQRIAGTDDFGVPVLKHGALIVAKVPHPGGFAAPVAAAKRSATTFIYV